MLLKEKLKNVVMSGIAYIKTNRHVWLVLWLPIYLVLFFLAEHLVTDKYFVSYLPLDNKIPFVDYFVVPYVLWFPFLFGTGIYFLVMDSEYFKKYMYFLMIGFTVSIVFCMLFPNGQDLRPEIFPRDNVFTRLIALLYSADTNTNVIPSMHVIGVVAASAAVLQSPSIKNRWITVSTVVLGLLINASTILIKQHSILDIFAAAALCVPIFFIVYGKDIKLRLKSKNCSTQKHQRHFN